MSGYRLDEAPQKQTNIAAKARVCATCDGDRFVSVGTRPVVQTPWMRQHKLTPPKDAAIEECAPCPDCNANANTKFHRADGTPVWSPDAARTRELMQR